MTTGSHILTSAIMSLALTFDTCQSHIDYLTNRFQVVVRLFSNRSQMTLKCGKNKRVAHEAQPSVSLMFLPHFVVVFSLKSMTRYD